MPKQLLKLLLDNKSERKPLRAQIEGDTETLYLYDAIVSTNVEADWYGGVSAEELVPLIRQSSAPKLALRINSGGGDIFAAQAIAQALRDFKGEAVAYIDGTCASAATVIACAASRVVMAAGGLYMVHRAWTIGMGNTNDFLATAALLDKADRTIALQYSAKTGETEDSMLALMDAETWLSAEEALAMKFIDEVSAVIKSQANKWNLSAYAKAPAQVQAQESPDDLVTAGRREYLARKNRLLSAQAN